MRDLPRGWPVLNRRSAIGGGGAALLCSCTTLGGSRQPLRFGLADITVMPELLRDYAGTLRRVAEMGYTTFGFRLYGYGGPEKGEPIPEAKARMVRESGMEVGVVRLGVRNVDYDRELGQAAEVGAKIVAMTTAPPFISGPKMFETTREAFDAWLPQLSAIGENARRRGLTLAYHNHPHDFVPIGGERPLDIMAREVPAEILAFEVDLAWAWYAGVSPLRLLTQLGSRVVSMHWKDIDRSRGTARSQHAVAPGLGEMNYLALLKQVRRITPVTGYVEVDQPQDGLAAALQGADLVRMALG